MMTSLKNMGVDDYDVVVFFAEVEDIFHVEVDDGSLMTLKKLSDVKRYIDQYSKEDMKC